MIKLTDTVDLSDCTLIIPSVAVGNVGQLTIDLLISNGKLKKIGHILTSSLIPIIGVDPYVKNSIQLCTSCDIYHDSYNKLIVIQIRSPNIKKLSIISLTLKEFIDNHKISKVIILTSGWAHTRTDIQIQSETIRYILSRNISSEFRDKIAQLKWIKLENERNMFNDSESMRIPGGGFALELFDYFNNHQIPVAIFLRFCSEGDNVPDAVKFSNSLGKLISLDINELRVPNSWKFLFGKPAPLNLY